MKFAGFARSALDELRRLPSLDAAQYATRRELLSGGLIVPARALIGDVVARLEVAGDGVQRVPAPWSDDHPRANLLRKTGFQVRFQLPLPRDAERPAFVPWCAERLNELIPAHRWLVKHLYPENDAR